MINNFELQGAVAPVQNVAAVADQPRLSLQLNLVHHLPGRLRLRSAALKGNSSASDEARARFAIITGVTSVTANLCTGSLLVEYDPAVLAPEQVIDALAHHSCFAAAAQQSPERDGGWVDRLASVVEGWIVDALAERLTLAVISALA